MNKILCFPRVRRVYECRFCDDETIKESRECWLFGKPIQRYWWIFMGWILMIILYPFIHDKIYYHETADKRRKAK